MSNALERAPMKDLVSTPAIKNRISDLLGKKSASFCSTLIQMSNQPHLKDCTSISMLGAAMTAAALDLPINQNLGFAYIVPYKSRSGKEAQFQMGYKGFIQLAQRTGRYVAMNDAVIPKGCMKSYNELTGELDVDFESETRDDLAEPDGYAFFFKLDNGFEKMVYWPSSKVEAHAKRYSQSYKSGYGPWVDNFEGMALKTLIKLTLSKYGPITVELEKALVNDQTTIDPLTDETAEIDYVDNIQPANEVSEEKQDDEKSIFDRDMAIRSIEVIKKHRSEDFNSVLSELDISSDMWKESPDNIISDMYRKLEEKPAE